MVMMKVAMLLVHMGEMIAMAEYVKLSTARRRFASCIPRDDTV